jgi:DNA-binding MarR family transcriptional regulator
VGASLRLCLGLNVTGGGRTSKQDLDPNDDVDAIALAWVRERPGTPVESIGIVTRVWRLAKWFSDDRQRVLAAAHVDAATLDLLGTLRRSGPPYRLTTREITDRSRLTAGAISQRIARAERDELVRRSQVAGSRSVTVTLTPSGHQLIDRVVDDVLRREADLVTRLSPSKRTQLTRLLKQLQDVLDDVVSPPAEVDSPPRRTSGIQRRR